MCQKCGCNTCETKSTALVLNESKAPKTILSEGLKHHIDTNKPLTEHLYRAGSRAYFDLFAEARSLYSRGILEFTHEDDLALLTETNLGHFGLYETVNFEGEEYDIISKDGDWVYLRSIYDTQVGRKEIKVKEKDITINETKVPLDFPIELNEQMDIYDDIANMEFGMDYDQLGSNEQEWVRDEIDNMEMRESSNESKMPTQDQVDKFFALTQNEIHYLNSKPVAGQEKTFNKMEVEPWDEYDLSNWNSLVRKAKSKGQLNENKINDFVDKWEDKIEKIPVIGPMISKGIDNLQGKVNTLVKTAKEEAGETREAMKIVAQYMRGETVGKEKNDFLKTQLKDLFKISGAVLAAIGFPPAAVIGFIVAKLGLGNELFKLDDADKTTTRGKDERKSIAGKIKTFDGVKYVPYKDILPYLEKGDISLGEVKRIDEAIANILDEKKKAKKKDNRPIGKPMRSSSGGKAYKVYVKDPKTKKVKTVRFGSGGLRAKINDSKARKAFAARHKCSQKKDRTKASYWSCRLPRYAKLLGLKSSFSGFW